MAQFTINTNDKQFVVENTLTLSTDCATIYEYEITAVDGDEITITLTGDHTDARYILNGVETSFDWTATIIYDTSLELHFILENSGNPGHFYDTNLIVDNLDTTSSILSYQFDVTRENDSAKCVNEVIGTGDGNTSILNNTVTGHRIATHNDGDGTIVDINETVTIAVLNGDNVNIDFTNESGITNQLDLTNLVKNLETSTSLTYNNTNTTLTFTNEDGNISTIDLSALAANIYVNGGTYNSATMVLTLTDTDPATPDVVIDLSTLQSNITNTVTGNRIATHDDGSGTTVDINETVTSLNLSNNILSYTKEDGTSDDINLSPFSSIETITSLSLNANILTYTDENGSDTDIDLSLYLDDTNLARLVSGTLDASTRLATFSRDDSSTFTVDFTPLFSAIGNDTLQDVAARDGITTEDITFDGGTVTYGDGTNGFFLGTNNSYGFLSIQSTAGFLIGDTTGTGQAKNFLFGQNGFGIRTESGYAHLKSDLITNSATFQFPTTAGIIPISFTDGTNTFSSNNAGEVDLSSLRNGIGVDTLQSVTERGSSTSEDITFTGSLTFIDAGSNYLGTISDSSFSMLHGEEITFLTTSSNNLVSLHKTNGLELRSLFNIKVKIGDGSNYTNPTVGQVLSAADTDGNLKWTDISSGGSVAGNDTEIQFNDNGVFGSSSNLVWDNTNNRLGIGITPTRTLDIKGSATSGFDIMRFSSQYSAVGYIGGDNESTWLSSGANGGNSGFKVNGGNAIITGGNTIQLRTSSTTRVDINSTGDTEFYGTVKSTQYKLSALNSAVVNSTDTGTVGEIRISADYIYICVATDTWKAAKLSTW